jgi:hypothetical protein
MTDYERVLDRLDTCRWDHMRVIADAAEEEGDPVEAAGWRWLADHGRWPSEETAYFGKREGRSQGETTSTGWKASYAAAFNHPSGWERDGYGAPCNHLPRPVVRLVKEIVKELKEKELTGRRYDPGDRLPSPVWLAAAARAVGEWLSENRPTK